MTVVRRRPLPRIQPGRPHTLGDRVSSLRSHGRRGLVRGVHKSIPAPVASHRLFLANAAGKPAVAGPVYHILPVGRPVPLAPTGASSLALPRGIASAAGAPAANGGGGVLMRKHGYLYRTPIAAGHLGDTPGGQAGGSFAGPGDGYFRNPGSGDLAGLAGLPWIRLAEIVALIVAAYVGYRYMTRPKSRRKR